jgi:hypothetical protein
MVAGGATAVPAAVPKRPTSMVCAVVVVTSEAVIEVELVFDRPLCASIGLAVHRFVFTNP